MVLRVDPGNMRFTAAAFVGVVILGLLVGSVGTRFAVEHATMSVLDNSPELSSRMRYRIGVQSRIDNEWRQEVAGASMWSVPLDGVGSATQPQVVDDQVILSNPSESDIFQHAVREARAGRDEMVRRLREKADHPDDDEIDQRLSHADIDTLLQEDSFPQ